MSNEWINVATNATSLQANFIRTVLEDAGIPCLMVGDVVGTTVGIWNDGNPQGVTVRVRVNHARRAHEIIDELENNHGEKPVREPHDLAPFAGFAFRLTLAVVASAAVGIGLSTVSPIAGQIVAAVLIIALIAWSLQPFLANA